MPILTFRCDDALSRDLERISKSDKKSKTDVIREALIEHVANRTRNKGKAAAAKGWETYIGAVQGEGDPRSATNPVVRKVIHGILAEKKRTGRV